MVPMEPQEGMVPLTIRLPQRVHEEMTEVARAERRSLNAALIVAAEQYIRAARRRLAAQRQEPHDAR